MLDILAIGAHPDDCEIAMAGTILSLKQQGYKVGVCDLCQGEAGTYGTAETRKAELNKASELLGLDARITLDLPDGNIRNTEENRLKLIDVIRQYRPTIVFGFYSELERHPDHYHAGMIVKECVFLAGLEKIVTGHAAYRPSQLIYFKLLIFNDRPDFVVDVTAFWGQKIEAIRAYSSQVTAEGEDDRGTKTFIRSNAFWNVLEARCTQAGGLIGVRYGEPFYCDAPARIQDIPAAFQR
jgi:N-acetylglucosamine malate deacetylase 1